MFTRNTSLVIPTKNRLKLLERLLLQLKKLKIEFSEILIVDSSSKKFKPQIKKISNKYNCKLFNTRSSISFQRNIGIKNKKLNSKFIMFLDDDIIFKKNAFRQMNKAINYYEDKSYNILGYGFNQINKKKLTNFEKIKNSKLIKLLGLYSDRPGVVMSSGWHTKIINLKTDKFTDWMYSATLIIPTVKLNSVFDESFGKYSYLEDLDFSLQMKKKNKNGKFLLIASAQFNHPNTINRNSFDFGILEFVNRYKIVSKHNLKYLNFFYMALIKLFLSFVSISVDLKNYSRFLGNIFGILICFKRYLFYKTK